MSTPIVLGTKSFGLVTQLRSRRGGGRFIFDFVICATGVTFDLALRPELNGIVEDIALWSDRFVPEPHETDA
jgi:hypothetical protein